MMIERASVFNPASPPARVLVFAPTPRGGLAEHVHYQARELARRGFAVTVLCHPDFAKSDPAYRREARLRSAQGNGPAARVARAALRIADYYGLAAAILRERPDWVLLEANSEYLSPAWFLPHWLLRRRGV